MVRRIRSLCEYAYLAAVGVFLLWDIAYMTEASWTFPAREMLPLAGVALAVWGLLLRPRPFVDGAQVLFLLWMGVSSAIAGGAVFLRQRADVLTGVLALLAVLPAARTVAPSRLTAFARVLLALWTAAMTALACIGLWAALTGHAVFSLRGTWYIGMNLGDLRLYPMAYVTTGAAKLGLSVLIALIGMALAHSRGGRILYGLCAAAMLCCLALTDCRTAFLAAGAAMGLVPASYLWRRAKKCKNGLLLRVGAAALPLVSAAALYVALSLVLTALGPCIPHEQLDNIPLTELPGHLLPKAAAEAAGEVQHRAIDGADVFNGRGAIWQAAFRLLADQPRLLLTGTTAVRAAELTNLYCDAAMTYAHVHDIYLHVLVAWGIPGLALLAAFLLRFAGAAWRVLMHHDLPLWQRLLPLPVCYVLLCDTVDCFTRFSAGTPMLLYGCFFAGWTLAVDAHAQQRTLPANAATVDVIIPAYNAADTVARAVESALVCPFARVVLVDDGSTDGTAARCDELAAGDPRITVLHQPNGGASAARNAGLAAATAEYVTFLDVDDTFLPGAVEMLLSAGCDAAQGGVVRGEPPVFGKPHRIHMTGQDALDQALRNPTAHLHTHGWLLRRELLTEAFDPSLTLGEDGEWMLRTLPRAKTAAYLDVPVYRYALRSGSALRGGEADVCGAYMRTLDAATPALKKAAPDAAAMYRLTHLLLMMTHGDAQQALRLRETPAFDEDFARVKLSGMHPRICVLRWMKRRWNAPVRWAVGLRRLMNRPG